MTEELLKQIREEVAIKKANNEKQNAKVQRIKELEEDPNVSEYIYLMGLSKCSTALNYDNTDQVICSVYNKYIYSIEEKDTNKIYIYLGTFRCSDNVDIVHSSYDIRVKYNDKKADYRLYQDLEQTFAKRVNIKDCDSFEKANTIINPTPYYKEKEYYNIQKEFFIKAIKNNQEDARKLVLKKYHKL